MSSEQPERMKISTSPTQFQRERGPIQHVARSNFEVARDSIIRPPLTNSHPLASKHKRERGPLVQFLHGRFFYAVIIELRVSRTRCYDQEYQNALVKWQEAGSAIPENLKKCPARPQKSLGKLGISSRLTLQEDLGLSRQAGLK